MNTISWGLLATGRIAGIFTKHLSQSKTSRIVAVGSRSQVEADRFGTEYNVPRRHGSYEALLADPNVQAVYISTPHPMHAEWCLKAAAAKKHILCEKPLTLNHAEAVAVIEAVRKHGVFLMEAFAYRCHPQTAKIVELIHAKVIGDVRIIHASFGFRADYDPESRLFNNQLGGGSILDVGCYPISMSRLIAGAAMAKPFAEPVEINGCAHFAPTGVDSRAIACLKFPGDIIAEISTAIEVQLENSVRIFGSQGNILVSTPWTPARDGSHTKILIERNGQPVEEILVESLLPRFAVEADYVAAHIAERQAPAMTWDDTLGNMKTLDRWRESIGLVYESEKAHKKSS
jgi:predicted dehydrogenase